MKQLNESIKVWTQDPVFSIQYGIHEVVNMEKKYN